MRKIRFENTEALTPHPMLARVGMMAGLSNHFYTRSRKGGKNREEHRERYEELTGDWNAFVGSIREKGIIEPIKICRVPEGDVWFGVFEWYIVDGRNRWTGAKECDLRRVPVIRVKTEDAPAIIAATVAGRRHYTKGAQAYLACLLHPEFALGGSERKQSNLKVGVSPIRTECGSETSPPSAEVLAAKYSVSTRLLEQAAELYRLVSDHPRHQEDAEADVWAGCGLGGVIAGVKSLIATGQRGNGDQSADAKRAVAAWTYTNKACGQLGAAWERWEHLGNDQRQLAVEKLTETLKQAPEDVRNLLKNIA